MVYPVKENIVARWMQEAGFRYGAYQKTYYVNRHKAPGVVADQRSYLKQNAVGELEVTCWLHLLMPEYKVMFQKVKVKQESEVEKFIRSKTHFHVNKNGSP